MLNVVRTNEIGVEGGIGRVARSGLGWGRAAIGGVALALVLGGCGKSEPTHEAEMVRAVRDHVEALPGGDLEAVLATVHPESAGLEETRQTVARLAEVGVEFDLEKVEVQKSAGDWAVVRFVLVARGPESFRDHRLTGVHELRRDGTQWKVFATQVERLEYLDDADDGVPGEDGDSQKSLGGVGQK